jgi:sec-independent protein translocase protein TatC
LFGRGENKADQTFIGHLEAFRSHLLRMSIAILLCSIGAFLFVEFIYENIILAPSKGDFPSYRWLCILGEKLSLPRLCLDEFGLNLQNLKVSGQFIMSITSAIVFGFIISFPYVAFELWRFIKPALTSKEVKMSRGIIFWLSILFFAGILFGYYIITPYTVNFFANYKLSDQIQNNFTIKDYMNTLFSLVLGSGLIFELPIVIYFLSRIGLVNPRFLRDHRRYAIVIVLVLAAVITPPDFISQVIVAIPIMILYEVSIRISARIEKKQIAAEKKLLEEYK